MFKNPILFLLLCSLSFVRGFAQTAPNDDTSNNTVSAEVQVKAVKTLFELAGEAERFSTPFNRLTARISVVELLWDKDEKQSRVIVQNSVSEIGAMLSQIPVEMPKEGDEEYYKSLAALEEVKNLRTELLMMLAKHDPKLALDTLQILARRKADGSNFFEEDQSLILNLAAQIIGKDPNKAYELAKQNLENGLNYALFSTLEDLYKKDSELGAKLAQDILNRIKSRDTVINSPYDTPPVNPNPNQTGKPAGLTISTWDLQTFLETVGKLNRQAARDKKSAVLSDGDVKDLLEVMVRKYLRQPNLSSYEVSKIMPDVIKYMPSQAQAIRAKINSSEYPSLNNMISEQNFQNESENKSADEISQIIEKKTPAEKDDLYWAAAQKAINDGDPQNARKFYSKMKTKRENDYLDRQIDNALPLAVAQNGDVNEVRQLLGKLKTPEERIEILTALAVSIQRKGDVKIAAGLLEEARSMYSGKMKNRKNLTSILQLAQAFAVIQPERGFALLESNIGYFNDLIGAAILLNEYDENGAVTDDELRLDTVSTQSFRNAPGFVGLFKDLCAADYERAVGLADKFSRPEVRFYTRYRIIQALLDPNAEALEKESQSNAASEEGGHID